MPCVYPWFAGVEFVLTSVRGEMSGQITMNAVGIVEIFPKILLRNLLMYRADVQRIRHAQPRLPYSYESMYSARAWNQLQSRP